MVRVLSLTVFIICMSIFLAPEYLQYKKETELVADQCKIRHGNVERNLIGIYQSCTELMNNGG